MKYHDEPAALQVDLTDSLLMLNVSVGKIDMIATGSYRIRSKASCGGNKVVKPHYGPSAVLVLYATGHNYSWDFSFISVKI